MKAERRDGAWSPLFSGNKNEKGKNRKLGKFKLFYFSWISKQERMLYRIKIIENTDRTNAHSIVLTYYKL